MRTASGTFVETTSGRLREALIEAIFAVRKGNLDHNDARAMALLAREVTSSLQAEVEARRAEKDVGADGVALIGEMVIGERAPEGERRLIKQGDKAK